MQQIYREWALLGILPVASLLSTVILIIQSYKQSQEFILNAIALGCIVGTQLIFWIFIYPVNQLTKNWTVLPTNWEQFRNRWEFSHAISALLNVFALILLIISFLSKEK